METSPQLQGVRFEGGPLPEGLREAVELPVGRRVPDWRLQREAEKLRRRLRESGHLDAEAMAGVVDPQLYRNRAQKSD